MYDEKGADGKRRYTVAEIAETFHVSRKTIYRHLERSGPTADPSPSG
jgi:DNA-binding XRE family transcriptional regulator